jgi:hypothetical protein
MTMWRHSEPAEEDVRDPPWQNKRRRSRRRAWRDGLADQTVVKTLESVSSYRAFERALVGSIDPRSVLELALVHRLASLFWRLRRADEIETGLFEIQSELLLARRLGSPRGPNQSGTVPRSGNGHAEGPGSNARDDSPARDQEPLSTSMRPPLAPWSKSRGIAQCFLRLSHLDPAMLDRVGRYEARLWRQAAQTIWTLEAMRRPPPALTRRAFRQPVVRAFWDAEHPKMR